MIDKEYSTNSKKGIYLANKIIATINITKSSSKENRFEVSGSTNIKNNYSNNNNEVYNSSKILNIKCRFQYKHL